MLRRRWIRPWFVGSVGFMLVGSVGYFLHAQNVLRRYPPAVELLPPPPEEPAVEVLSPPDTGPVKLSPRGIEPVADIPLAELGTPLEEIEGTPLEPVDESPTLDAAVEPALPLVDLSQFDKRGNLPMTLTAAVPNRVQSGSGATFHLRVTNTSDRTLDATEVECRFSGSLAFPGRAIQHVKRPLSSLKSGDSREVMLTLVGAEPGWGLCRFTISADGVAPIEQQYQIAVIPRLWDLNLIGPAGRTAGQRSEFMLRLSNRTVDELRGLQIRLTSAAILKPANFGEGLEKNGPEYIWRPDDLAPGRTLMLPFEFLCADPSEQACVSVWVSGDGVPEDKIDACLAIAPPNDYLAVDFADVRDPVRRGDAIVYEAIIENRALQAVNDVALVIESTAAVSFQSVEAEWEPAYLMLPKPEWQVTTQRIECRRLPDFPASARLKFVVKAQGVEVGDAELRLNVTAKQLSTPLSFTEYTSIASERP